MNTHTLKVWPEYFESLTNGTKNFEVRKYDRDFKIGDFLILQEYIPEGRGNNSTPGNTGKEIKKTIDYILHGVNLGFLMGTV